MDCFSGGAGANDEHACVALSEVAWFTDHTSSLSGELASGAGRGPVCVSR